MDNKNQKIENAIPGSVQWYKDEIVGMLEHIEEQRFLKAIYISMSGYLKEKEPG